MNKFMKFCCSPKVIISAAILLALVFLSPLRSYALAYLPFAVLLACSIICAVVMMFMMKDHPMEKKDEQESPDKTV